MIAGFLAPLCLNALNLKKNNAESFLVPVGLGLCIVYISRVLLGYFYVYFLLFVASLVDSSNPADCVERLVSETTCYSLTGFI